MQSYAYEQNQEAILQHLLRLSQFAVSPKSLSLLDIPDFKESYEDYPEHVKILFDTLFNQNSSPFSLSDLIDLKVHKTPMPLCNKLFNPREKIYRCFDCLIHEAAVYCGSCFHHSNHKGHRFEQSSSGGGNCDCGNNQALKSFCTDHSGEEIAYPVTQEEIRKFNEYFQNLLNWSQQLVQKFEKQGFGYWLLQSTLQILEKFNIESLYYNTLTHQLLFKNEKSLIDYIFRVGVTKSGIGHAATNMFLNMFSIFDFKLQLTIEFVNNYNKLVNFEQSSFSNLYIQLFANDNVLAKMFDMKNELSPKQKIVIDPRGKPYNLEQYYSHLEFMCSVSFESSKKFFKQLFSEVKCLELVKLNTIFSEIQNGESKIENYASFSLNTENCFYNLMIQIIKKLSADKQFIAELIRNHIQAIEYYKFIKNKIVLVPQRIFGVLVFAYSEGSLETISIQKIIEITNLSKQQLKILLLKISNQIIHCFQDWSLSMVRQSFFLNYTPMYVNSGLKVVGLDYLTFRVCAVLLSKLGCQVHLGQEVENIFKNEIQKLLKADPPTQSSEYLQFCQKWAKTVNILIEISISNRCQIWAASKLELKSTQIIGKKIQLIKSLFFLKKQISHDQFKQLSYDFYGGKIQNDSELILQVCTFDTGRRKFIIKQGTQGDPLMFDYLQSVKSTHMSKNFEKTKQLSEKVALNETIMFYRNVLLSSSLIQGIFSNFLQLIDKLKNEKYALSFTQACQQMSKRLSSLSEGKIKISDNFEDILEQLKTTFGRSVEKESQVDEFKIKKDLKKQKRIQQHAALQAKFASEQNSTAKQAVQTCLICSQTENSINQLYHLTFLSFSNNMQAMFHQKGYNLYFTGCNHLFHYKCFQLSETNHNLIQCPLCKSTNNCFFPAGQITKKDEMIPKIYTIISKIHSNFIQSSMQDSIPTISLFGKIFLYLVEFAVLSRIKHSPVTELEIQNAKIVCLLLKNYIISIQEQDLKQECANILNYPDEYSSKQTAQCQLYFQKLTIEMLIKWLMETVITEVNFEAYLKFVNLQDLIAVVDLVNKITNNNVRMPQNLIEVEGITRISKLNHYCSPPKTIADLLELRDKATLCTKEPSHQMFYCLLCKQFLCYECQQVINHTRQVHFGNTIFLNINDGRYLQTIKNVFAASSSLYQDDLGVTWTPGKQIEGYKLNEKEYRLKMIKMQTHSR